MNEFSNITEGLMQLIDEWEPKLQGFPDRIICERRNSQQRTIKQIVGHLIDSASNNTHRIIHMQYQQSPLQFPNYASNGNNDRWIAIQNYQQEEWNTLVQLWKYANLHLIHVIENVDNTKLNNTWQYSNDGFVSLRGSIIDYLRHFKLHLSEIAALAD